MITIGIDIGSRTTKIAVIGQEKRDLLYSGYDGTSVLPADTVTRLLHNFGLTDTNIQRSNIACTGYGRKAWPGARRIFSEISCHAAGVRYYYPDCRTIIDVGGQDSKVIFLSEEGAVQDFCMNDKCAAGTGRFLEMLAVRLDCSVADLSRLAQTSDSETELASTCVVFAESEIIGLLAQNEKMQNIIRSAHNSIARRIAAQLFSFDFQPPIVFTGGVAQNQDLVQCLAKTIDLDIVVPPDPEITGALGAALLALK
jgi:(R)-2-hydroxyacyl-CoA dehydratese activating ATPase